MADATAIAVTPLIAGGKRIQITATDAHGKTVIELNTFYAEWLRRQLEDALDYLDQDEASK